MDLAVGTIERLWMRNTSPNNEENHRFLEDLLVLARGQHSNIYSDLPKSARIYPRKSEIHLEVMKTMKSSTSQFPFVR